jgi:hypothetical protein
MQEYIEEKRSVTEQELRLTAEEKKKVFAILYENALPQNRNYAYDFFWDNCATRPRDVFEKVLGSKLTYHTENAGFAKDKTMHDMLRLYVHDRLWVDFGFDLILGLPCEVIATPRNQTFLPDYLAKYFASATVEGHPFVTKTQTLIDAPLPSVKVLFQPIHLTVLLMVAGFGLLLLERKKSTHYYKFDFILFFVTGLLGLLFLCLWAFTTHYSVPKNLNMLWLIPSHTIVSFLLLKKEKPKWLGIYFLCTYILMMLLLIAWKWNPQHYNIAFAPIIILMAARSFTIFSDLKKG